VISNPIKILQDLDPTMLRHPSISAEQDVQDHSPTSNSAMTCLHKAAQSALEHLDVAFANLGFIEGESVYLQAIISQPGWSSAHPFMSLHNISLAESFSIYVWLNGESLAINDTTTSPDFRAHWLVQRYGIRAYLGVPVVTTQGQCLGVLEVMDDQPREFSRAEIALLEMIAHCCTRELELSAASAGQIRPQDLVARHPGLRDLWQKSESLLYQPFGDFSSGVNLTKFKLLSQLTQSLRTSLTPVLGMTSVLRQQIHGNLTLKQREYLDIVYQSGQDLLALINEISEISQIDQVNSCSLPAPVDLELLCQQAIAAIDAKAKQRDQQLRLTVEDNARIWLFDRDRIRQSLHHLIVGATEGAMPGSALLIHLSRRDECLRFVIWASHPWLGDGLGQSDLINLKTLFSSKSLPLSTSEFATPSPVQSAILDELEGFTSTDKAISQPVLRILLSQRLVETLGGQLTIQGSSEAGYRLVLVLPPARLGESNVEEE
jgi:hypothetical protein